MGRLQGIGDDRVRRRIGIAENEFATHRISIISLLSTG